LQRNKAKIKISDPHALDPPPASAVAANAPSTIYIHPPQAPQASDSVAASSSLVPLTSAPPHAPKVSEPPYPFHIAPIHASHIDPLASAAVAPPHTTSLQNPLSASFAVVANASFVPLPSDPSSVSSSMNGKAEASSSPHAAELDPRIAWRYLHDEPLRTYRDDLRRMYQLYGFCLSPPTADSLELAQLMLKIKEQALSCEEKVGKRRKVAAESATSTPKGWLEIAGEVISFDVKEMLEADVATRGRIMELRDRIIQHMWKMTGRSAAGRKSLCRDKILVARPGVGRQAVHWDAPIPVRIVPDGSLSMIIYCTYTDSTALPRFPSCVLSWPRDDDASNQAHAFLLHPDFFHSVPVTPGTILIFDQSTPHFGVENVSKTDDRVALFDIISEIPDAKVKSQDEYQYYVWEFVRDCFGIDSDEFVYSVLQNWKHNPISRYSGSVATKMHNAVSKKLGQWQNLIKR
jgi:hypothetical protein